MHVVFPRCFHAEPTGKKKGDKRAHTTCSNLVKKVGWSEVLRDRVWCLLVDEAHVPCESVGNLAEYEKLAYCSCSSAVKAE